MPLIPRTPPKFPEPVPLWWCLWRQCSVVGFFRAPLNLGLIWDSAHTLKAEIDQYRAETRARSSSRRQDWRA